MDGRHTVAEIAATLSGELPLTQTLTALRKFAAFGVLAEGRPDWPEGTLAFWDAQGIDPVRAHAALERAEFTVVACGDADAGPVEAVLREHGLRIRTRTVEDEAAGPGASCRSSSPATTSIPRWSGSTPPTWPPSTRGRW